MMIVEPTDAMRQLMEVVQIYSQAPEPVEILEETAKPEPTIHPIINDLNDLTFKMRSIQENDSNSDYALGFEMGMQRAAEMVENLINRHLDSGE